MINTIDKNTIINILVEIKEKSVLIPTLIQEFKEGKITNTNLEEMFSLPVVRDNKKVFFELLVSVVENGNSSDYIFNKFRTFVKENMEIFEGELLLKKLTEMVDFISFNHTEITQEQLKIVLDLLEHMYARGYREIRDSISKIYKCLDFDNFDNGDYITIRKRLAGVYLCNAYNYIEIGRKLDTIMLECKKAKLKHYHGMVHYYYALYYSITQNFSRRYSSEFFTSSGTEYHIYEAKERQFRLAEQFVY